ncbi:hypothetical protein [Deinococcus yavapaiensis]|uniref:Uncharacterized protein n=1 Tax=Deinococcus yavapaiensis KR-236 TaxID=694435 RepID=A0A318RZT8_9DEIO|nr:hypothetical protein [Deinococcus yavapaiensis]PYE49458.1 hypothetical protein DES52_1224 [Deinococcus yavapaiensis KR-236]
MDTAQARFQYELFRIQDRVTEQLTDAPIDAPFDAPLKAPQGSVWRHTLASLLHRLALRIDSVTRQPA